jgi:hypothetical protein
MKSVSFIMKDGAIYKQDNQVVMPIGDQRASEPGARDPSDEP